MSHTNTPPTSAAELYGPVAFKQHAFRETELLADLASMGHRLQRADVRDFDQLAQSLTAMALRLVRSHAEARVFAGFK